MEGLSTAATTLSQTNIRYPTRPIHGRATDHLCPHKRPSTGPSKIVLRYHQAAENEQRVAGDGVDEMMCCIPDPLVYRGCSVQEMSWETEVDREGQGRGCELDMIGFLWSTGLQETSTQFSFLAPTNRESDL